MNLILPLLLILDGKLAIVLGRRYLRFWARLFCPFEKTHDWVSAVPEMAIRLVGAAEVGIGLFVLLRHRRRERSAAAPQTD